MSIKDEIKANIIRKGMTMTKTAEILGISRQSLSQKITKETISYKDVLELAETLGYEIKWVDKLDKPK